MVEEKGENYSLHEERANFPACAVDLVREYFREHTDGREHLIGIYLDNQCRPQGIETISIGTIDQCAIYPREIIKSLILLNANQLIIAHNHPSNNPEPGTADRDVTRKIATACAAIDSKLLDHIIVGEDDKYFSFMESGIIPIFEK